MAKKHKQSLTKSILQSIGLALFLAASMLMAKPLHDDYLLDKVGNNTVFIRSPIGAKHQGSATGFEVIAPSGRVYTLTNAHVCELQKDGVVMVEEKLNSKRLIPRRVLEVYADNDLCLVEGLEGYEGLKLADSYEIGDFNYAIGYPLGEAMDLTGGYIKSHARIQVLLSDVPPSDCNGPHLKIVQIDTFFGPLDFCAIERRAVQTNITIYPGNSGSAMVNAFGHVTGVIFASNNYTHWGSAVPLADVVDFIKAY